MSSNSKGKLKSSPLDRFLRKRKQPESSFEKEGTTKSSSNQEANSPQENTINATGGSNPKSNSNKECEGSGKGSTPRTQGCSKQHYVDVSNLPVDPGERKMINEYHPDQHDEIRREYILRGPVQPRKHNFPPRKIGGKARKFNRSWFSEYGWLEYSIKKDAAFCFYCYLFPGKGNGAFSCEGWSCWNKKGDLRDHVGIHTGAHFQAKQSYENFKRQDKSIRAGLEKQSELTKKDCKLCLSTTIACSRYLLNQGLSFRGHDESEKSKNRGNFLELVKFAASLNDTIAKVVLNNAPGNLQMTAPKIQKDIVNCAASETVGAIIEEIGDDFFGILVDESGDVSHKEQMAVVLRFVDKLGVVKERFVGIVHVENTCALTIKKAIEELLSKHGLSLSNARAQGYDGASNMCGEFNGLKSLILKEIKCAYYIHCFAHQLQLTLVAVAKKHEVVTELFDCISCILNVVGASCKRHDMIRRDEAIRIAEGLANGEIESGTGLNQELSLKRAGDTRWGSHYRSLMNVVALFTSIVNVLEYISMESDNTMQVVQAKRVQAWVRTFDFAFSVHLMIDVLGITNDLSLALQKKDQDIANAVKLVEVCKARLQHMRDDGFEHMVAKVHAFCDKHDIFMPDMDDTYVIPGRTKRNAPQESNSHHYRVNVFYSIIDMQLLELHYRLSEINTELLLCVSCLSPDDKFCNFDKCKLTNMAKLYPNDFSEVDVMALENQLGNYIVDVATDDRFDKLKGIGELSKVLVETKKHEVYFLVYRLLKLALVLPVATASVERAFSGMNIIKTRLRNRMCDQFLGDCLLCYVEKDVFAKIDNDAIMHRFQNMRSRRVQL